MPLEIRAISCKSSNEMAELAQLMVDHVAGPAEVGVIHAVALHDPQGVADRGQGIAQLVTEHGQELVLAHIGLGKLAHSGLAAAELVRQPMWIRGSDHHDRVRIHIRFACRGFGLVRCDRFGLG